MMKRISLIMAVLMLAMAMMSTALAYEEYTWGSASLGGSAQMVITAIGTLVSDKDPNLNINV